MTFASEPCRGPVDSAPSPQVLHAALMPFATLSFARFPEVLLALGSPTLGRDFELPPAPSSWTIIEETGEHKLVQVMLRRKPRTSAYPKSVAPPFAPQADALRDAGMAAASVATAGLHQADRWSGLTSMAAQLHEQRGIHTTSVRRGRGAYEEMKGWESKGAMEVVVAPGLSGGARPTVVGEGHAGGFFGATPPTFTSNRGPHEDAGSCGKGGLDSGVAAAHVGGNGFGGGIGGYGGSCSGAGAGISSRGCVATCGAVALGAQVGVQGSPHCGKSDQRQRDDEGRVTARRFGADVANAADGPRGNGGWTNGLGQTGDHGPPAAAHSLRGAAMPLVTNTNVDRGTHLQAGGSTQNAAVVASVGSAESRPGVKNSEGASEPPRFSPCVADMVVVEGCRRTEQQHEQQQRPLAQQSGVAEAPRNSTQYLAFSESPAAPAAQSMSAAPAELGESPKRVSKTRRPPKRGSALGEAPQSPRSPGNYNPWASDDDAVAGPQWGRRLGHS